MMASIQQYKTRQGLRYRVRYHRTDKSGFLTEEAAREFARGIEEQDFRQGNERALAKINPPPPGEPKRRPKVDKEYKYAHSEVTAFKGRAALHSCVDCSGQARQWSYDHADYFEETTTSGLLYSLDPAHYEPRCASCHRLFDIRMRKIPRLTASEEEREVHRQQVLEEIALDLDDLAMRMQERLWPEKPAESIRATRPSDTKQHT